MDWYNIKNIDTIDSPALVVYKERVQENIRLLKSMVNDTARLRPHVKTNKMTEAVQMMIDAGIHKFKCATIAEAEMLAMTGATDVLLAYQLVGPKAARFITLIMRYPGTRFSCLGDNIAAMQDLSALCQTGNVSVNVLIDLNTGMNRTGIVPAKALLFYEAVALLPAIHVTGLHVYDGHIRDTDIAARTQHANSGYTKALVLAEAITAISGATLIIVAGGSPTFPIHAQHPHTECSPGTFIFWDWGYKHAFPDEPFDYAALLVTRVISIIDETTITTDLGHKSVAAENPLPRVYFLNAPDIMPVSQSEEHLTISAGRIFI